MNMIQDYEQFLLTLNNELNIAPWYDYRSSHNTKDRIGVSWSLGGTSCGYDHKTEVSGEIEPEFTEIDSILEYYCPDISYLQYRSMSNKLLNKEEESSGDYYGGSITYGYKYIYLEELFEWLKEKNYIKSE